MYVYVGCVHVHGVHVPHNPAYRRNSRPERNILLVSDISFLIQISAHFRGKGYGRVHYNYDIRFVFDKDGGARGIKLDLNSYASGDDKPVGL